MTLVLLYLLLYLLYKNILCCYYRNAATNSSGLQMSDLEMLKTIEEITGEDHSSYGLTSLRL